MTTEIAITLIILALSMVSFVWEKITIATTSMVVMLALILTRVITPAQGFAGFVNGTVILFFGMFIVGAALEKTGMAHAFGEIVTRRAKTERQLMVALMIAGGLLSSFISNTTAMAIMIPVVIGICKKSGINRSRLLLPVAYATSMFGGMTLTSTSPNVIASELMYEMAGQSFGFFEFAWVSIPRGIAGILFFALIGYKLLPNHPDVALDDNVEQTENFDHVPKWKKVASVLVLLAASIAFVFEAQLAPMGIPIHVVSSIAAITVVILGLVTQKQAFNSVDQPTIFLFAGLFALAAAMTTTGAGDFIAYQILSVVGNVSGFTMMVVFIILGWILTTFISNPATAALLVPISIPISNGLGINPATIVMAIAMSSSLAYMSPITTPPNTMVYGIGNYKFVDYFKVGFPLVVVTMIVVAIFTPIFFPFAQ